MDRADAAPVVRVGAVPVVRVDADVGRAVPVAPADAVAVPAAPVGAVGVRAVATVTRPRTCART